LPIDPPQSGDTPPDSLLEEPLKAIGPVLHEYAGRAFSFSQSKTRLGFDVAQSLNLPLSITVSFGLQRSYVMNTSLRFIAGAVTLFVFVAVAPSAASAGGRVYVEPGYEYNYGYDYDYSDGDYYPQYGYRYYQPRYYYTYRVPRRYLRRRARRSWRWY
jgi:hypothetical protein